MKILTGILISQSENYLEEAILRRSGCGDKSGNSQEERTCDRDPEIKSYSEISNNKFGFVTTKEISSPRYQKISMDLKMSFIWNSLKARLFKSFLSTYLCKMQMISGRLDQKT